MFKDALLKFLKLEGLMDNLTGYIEARVELLKMDVKEDVARLMSKILLLILVAVTFTFFLVLISIAVAVYLGSLLGMFSGFLIVAGFYLLIGLLILLFRKDLGSNLEKKLLNIVQQTSK